jgi:hypothetical protein
MKVYSDTLTRDRLARIAEGMGVRLYEYSEGPTRSRGKFAGKAEHKFLLRPVTDEFRSAKRDAYCKAGVRRIWAVSWAGHYVFMRALLDIDPDASIVTSVSQYHGSLDFAASAFATRRRNVGSMMEPQSYGDAQSIAHVPWESEDDLCDLARRVGCHV